MLNVYIYIGTARGCGWQKIGAFVNLGAYYLMGLPSAIALGFFFHFGAKVVVLFNNIFESNY